MASTHQALAALGISLDQLYAAMHRGVIPKPATRIGPAYVWTEAEIAAAKAILDARRQQKANKGQPAEGGVAA